MLAAGNLTQQRSLCVQWDLRCTVYAIAIMLHYVTVGATTLYEFWPAQLFFVIPFYFVRSV
jgi:hypothetical protein